MVALGGNALLRRGESLDAATQRANIKVAAEAVAGVAAHHQVVLTHGNGPQVGLLALQNAASVAGLLLTTEALVTDLPEDKPAAAPPMPHGDF